MYFPPARESSLWARLADCSIGWRTVLFDISLATFLFLLRLLMPKPKPCLTEGGNAVLLWNRFSLPLTPFRPRPLAFRTSFPVFAVSCNLLICNVIATAVETPLKTSLRFVPCAAPLKSRFLEHPNNHLKFRMPPCRTYPPPTLQVRSLLPSRPVLPGSNGRLSAALPFRWLPLLGYSRPHCPLWVF